MTEAQKKAVEVQKEIEEACIRHDLILLSLKMELDLSILKRIRLSWYGDLSINQKRHRYILWRKTHQQISNQPHRNRPAEICPLSYLAVQREVADLWETKGNIQSEE